MSRIPLPFIILANARSLRNKTEELQALLSHQHDSREACILAVTETWLGESDSDNDVATKGFGAPLRTDYCDGAPVIHRPARALSRLSLSFARRVEGPGARAALICSGGSRAPVKLRAVAQFQSAP